MEAVSKKGMQKCHLKCITCTMYYIFVIIVRKICKSKYVKPSTTFQLGKNTSTSIPKIFLTLQFAWERFFSPARTVKVLLSVQKRGKWKPTGPDHPSPIIVRTYYVHNAFPWSCMRMPDFVRPFFQGKQLPILGLGKKGSAFRYKQGSGRHLSGFCIFISHGLALSLDVFFSTWQDENSYNFVTKCSACSVLGILVGAAKR